MTHYAIVDIRRGHLMYAGISLMTAAVNLVEGTCWGDGPSGDAAYANAVIKASWHRANGYKPTTDEAGP